MLRREFLQTGVAAGAGLVAGGLLRGGADVAHAQTPGAKASTEPVVVSTWNFGARCNRAALQILMVGGSALDAVENGVAVVESDPTVDSVGYGGLPNADGVVQLDAAIMDGRSLEVGSVAALEKIKNPIRVARRVMEKTPHVLLVGEGARRFAVAQGFTEEELLTDEAKKKWTAWKAKQPMKVHTHDTIGAIAIDGAGEMAAACTTSGLAWKLPGRVGDSPIVGGGLYCDGEVGGCVATGVGEEILKVCGSFLVVELMRQGRSAQEAVNEALARTLRRDAGNREKMMAFLALRKDGTVGFGCTTPGFQAAVDRRGKAALLDAPAFGAAPKKEPNAPEGDGGRR